MVYLLQVVSGDYASSFTNYSILPSAGLTWCITGLSVVRTSFHLAYLCL